MFAILDKWRAFKTKTDVDEKTDLNAAPLASYYNNS